ncbi:MAG: hypothetical protein QXP71_05380 [Desulfurococcaceae archaeon]|uniref:Uncharacterized protein n=1 Tax=Staphylothermus marinus TaxID=2280 RepID=A0A7C4D9V9_STAMA
MNLLKPVEENALFVFLIYRSLPNSNTINDIFRRINSILIKTGLRRIVFYVYSNDGNPYYLSILRDILQNNILYSIVTRYYELSLDEIIKTVDKAYSSGSKIIVFIDKNLNNIVDQLIEKELNIVLI